ncbi:lipopolysaccharide biosynthesis protein [Neobacillus soli]|uniref:lipopolysaccharide biosynthesis protein n=1 Tax=Neobacillus soli TaxID=220688 RepID=UPI0008270CA3|nr:flippase [Neobacillus soli]
MRSINSIKNISISVFSQLIIVLLGFISRKVFLDSLGVHFLGVNGLLESVLSILGLVESGIGTSIVYHLYKPLAENNRPKIIALIKLYKKAYAVIAIIVFVLSIILYPFLVKLLKDSGSISYITIVYFIFVAKNMTYYLNAHKVALINADQKGYVLIKVNFGFQVITTIAKIIVLINTGNFLLYLIIELTLYIIQNVVYGRIVEKRYSYIKTKETFNTEKGEKENIIKNVKALFFHNIGTYIVFGTDNILISSFIGITTVGIYSNYSMIIGQLGFLVSPLLSGIGASVGNLIAIESKRKMYEVFKITYLMNFWIFSLCVIFLYNLLEPFINWWLGKGYILDSLTFLVLLVNFYITGLRSAILIFKAKGGIFVQDKYIPLVEATINLVLSLILVNYLGLAGIFIGTTVSTLTTVFWNAPRLVYKHIFNIPVWSYYFKYIMFTTLTIITCVITKYICNFLVEGNGLLSLIEKGIICLLIPNIVYFILFYRSEEFRYILSTANNVIFRLRMKLKSAG